MVDRLPARPLRDDWSHPEFAAIARELHQVAGLVFPPNRRESAEAGMRRAMAAGCLPDPGDLRRAIVGTGETRDALITELTVGETFFLRERGQFDFLRDRVLPELRTTVGPRRVRMWSAGCATGEEPYSLAILLREAGWQGAAAIIGTDLAAPRLAAARRARYTAWSMRGVSEPIKNRYFERRGKQFILRADIRQSVEFRVLNLASSEYPSPLSGIEQMDVVLCRNVLIYFDTATVSMIAARLLASLAPGGWLFLGASDPSIADLVPCEVVLTGAGLAYRAAEGRTREGFEARTAPWTNGTEPWESIAPILEPAWEQPAVTFVPATHEPVVESPARTAAVEVTDTLDYAGAYEQREYETAALLARAAIDRGDDTEDPWIVLVRSLANRGQLGAAGEACAAALERHTLSAELTHLHGILLAESGRHAEAAVAARRALYLDPGIAVAHLALGDALAHIGEVDHARRAFTNAARILGAWPADTPVPGADGADASQLLGIARFRIGMLPGAASARSR